MLQTSPTEAALAEAPPKPILQLVGVRKTFGSFAAVENIDLDVREGEFLTIVGPSGSGKTTLLRMLAGMDTPSEGNITLHGELINDVPPNKRPTCLVFQSLALFPHKSVGENIAFPLKVKGVDAAARKARALELMRIVRLPESYHDKNVMKCSGGERQRVALARALAYDPEVLFFDEPLSAIDYKLKKTLEKELKDLHRETGKTFIYITHSLEEAMVMSDRIGVMRAGRLVQVGTPEEIYGAPVDRFVCEFVGEVNTIKVKRGPNGLWSGVDVPGSFHVAPPQNGAAPDEAFVVVRPEFMRFLGPGESADNRLEGTVYNEYSLGSRIQYQVRVEAKGGEKVMLVELSRARALAPGADPHVTLGWDAADAFTLES
ncbi:ABC transporter related protein [Ancylobacter novellus DSM 506]|uniref:ABC transporter related protein n=1 Tax=Ancylobacter novellus (strain ATCC 8093 / DSM 506 / JCM 20403 / CCM 1077 / IAM 12100 / NBRC 12443 / NCIMB 10456) TaxID=639283 RepID=D7A0L3_ANCN5|nr:ABC transporter ATP-binding protein [Ancylobacter novellus]ADH91334.1 ABC transporter related protein [Ancylobacter novellus DSM 506]